MKIELIWFYNEKKSLWKIYKVRDQFGSKLTYKMIPHFVNELNIWIISLQYAYGNIK